MPLKQRDVFKIEKESDGVYYTYEYPKLPYNVDFETFRKTDSQWKKIVEIQNQRVEIPGVVNHQPLYRERFIYARWPRDPNGPIMAATPVGKVAGNGFPLWGATLYDFYRMYRHPQLISAETLSTGSKLAAWMKEIGELDAAPVQLKQAAMEDEPHELEVFDIGQYIEVLEEQVWKGRVGKPMQIDRKDRKIGTQLLFAPSEYPAPWPLRPFSAPLARLQKRIPHSALPRKLIVHDPWNVLCVKRDEEQEEDVDPDTCKWGTEPDIIRTYHLELSEDARKQQESKENGTGSNGAQHCPVAHLYITPRRRIGSGHHSFVYQVELEVPREMLVQPKVCYECTKITDQYVEGILEEKAAAQGLAGAAKSHEELLKDIPGLDLADDPTMQRYYSRLFKNGRPFAESDREVPLFEMMKFAKGQNRPPFCRHLDHGIPAPPSQRVSVTAKLSLPKSEEYYETENKINEHLEHLRREAENYQSFPSHMFEHWNGYNVLPPMHDPTPVGAVVPQFYGFYVPDESGVKKGEYMSPILLLEHCGVQVNPTELPMDDRRECFSLIRRLHCAGYVHQSVYQRNFVIQYGPLQESPFKRSKLHPRFRLIDFGRSYKCEGNKAFREQSIENEFTKRNLEIDGI